MNHSQIIRDLKQKKYQPVYFLYGSEAYFIDLIADYIENNVLSDAEKSFNQTILYGKEVDAKTVIDTAYRYPMMAPRQVVLLKEAQEMRSLKKLQAYVEKAVPTTILVICHKHKKFNINTKFGKILKAKAVVLNAKKLYDNQVPDWISSYLSEKKYRVQPNAAALMAEYLGTDLSKIANELDKLLINLPTGTTITPEQVEKNIGISKDYNVFELQKALGQKDVLKANRIINYFTENPKKGPLVMVVGALFNYFSKIYMLQFVKHQAESDILKALSLRSSWFLKEYKAALRHYNRIQTEQVIHLLKEYDLKAKGVAFNNTTTAPGELLKEMIWRILYNG